MSYITDSFDEEVIRSLNSGGVGLLPSDTIYGLSCKALDQAAVERIYLLKGRDANKPFIVLISKLNMLNYLAITDDAEKIIGEYWPGSLSVIFESAGPDYLTRGTKSLAIRMPNQPALLELISKVGPIVSTSANLEGQEPAHSVVEAQSLFGNKLDFYVDAGQVNGVPSTLAAVKGSRLEVIRPGAVKIDDR